MKSVHDLQIQHKCFDCSLKGITAFCQLPENDLRSLEEIKLTKASPKGTTLFAEGQKADGAFLLCQGKVKLSSCSKDGKIIIIGVAGPGELLGLSAVLNNREYETTAEALELCQVNFIKSEDLIDYLETNPAACLNAARQLSRNYHAAYRQVCSLGLSESVAEKLAKLFLGWSGNGSGVTGRIEMKNHFTHEEMAEMIGTSRETVTRALRYFRETGLVTVKGSDLIIHDRQRLSAVVTSQNSSHLDM